MTYCPACGATLKLEVPAGDHRPRHVCGSCEAIHYLNPRIIVGAVVTWDGKYLLCRRAIEPRRNFWTIPAGFMELQETAEEGAARETREEALAEIQISQLLGAYSVPTIGQVHLLYAASMAEPAFGPGEESLEVVLFDWADIPWDEIAFPSVTWALNKHREAYPPGLTTTR